jgi:CRP/FNR family cyclic AMP-dependent transcriptional regulator
VLTREAAFELMSREGWLSRTPRSFCQAVLDRSVLQRFEAGATIYESGDPPGGMYGLVSGAVGVSVTQGRRGPYLAHFFRPGEWFGEGPAISGRPRVVGLAAGRDSELLHLPLHAVDAIVADQPGSWRFFAWLTMEKLQDAMWAIDDLMIREGSERIVAVLLRLSGSRFPAPRGSGPNVVHVSQEDLAAMANVSRSTANAVLRRLESAGHVKQSYRQIRIVSPDIMRAMLTE